MISCAINLILARLSTGYLPRNGERLRERVPHSTRRNVRAQDVDIRHELITLLVFIDLRVRAWCREVRKYTLHTFRARERVVMEGARVNSEERFFLSIIGAACNTIRVKLKLKSFSFLHALYLKKDCK